MVIASRSCSSSAAADLTRRASLARGAPVAAEELNRAKRSVAGNYLFRNQLQGAVAASLANGWLLGRPPEYLGEYVGRTNQVTAAQVQAIATKYFDPKQLSIVVVGDQAVVAQLTPYGKFVTKSK